MVRNVIDHTGKKFGNLTVTGTERVESPEGRTETFCFCLCECGKTARVRSALLVSGNTKSCGCLKKEAGKVAGKSNITHGDSNSAEYYAWIAARQRCSNGLMSTSHLPKYQNILMQAEWVEDFENFLRDMGKRPHPKSRLTRADKTKGFNKHNCYWRTPQEKKVLNTVK